MTEFSGIPAYTPYKEKFHRLKARRGAKRAITAIAHKFAKVILPCHLKEGEDYRELGEDYLDRLNKPVKLNRLRSQAKAMGYVLVPASA